MKIGAIKKCRNYLSQSLTLVLYKSLVVPLMDYCDVAYMQTNQNTLNRLQIVQNIACRVILKAAPRNHISDMHKELKLDYLHDRRKLHLLAECHKCIHTTDNYPLKRYFKLNMTNPNRRTRRVCRYDVLVPRVKTSTGQ